MGLPAAGLELKTYDGLPDGLLDAPAADLARLLGGPSLIALPGRQTSPLFVSVLLHGNEHTGWEAAQMVLRRHAGRELPRSLLLFVGNVAAAAENVRRLPDQADFNRVWPGTPMTHAPEAALMRRVCEIAAAARPFASIDIHNNSGSNPHYACVNRIDHAFLHVARLFTRTVVLFERPAGVQSAAMAAICPAVTVECGRSGVSAGNAHAAEFIEAALSLSHIPGHPVPPQDIDLLRTDVIVRVPAGVPFSFHDSGAIRFRPDLDQLNFSETLPGTLFGWIEAGAACRLEVLPGNGAVTELGAGEVAPYFRYDGDEIRLARPAIPAMLTTDPRAVELDCLGYLMHRIDLAEDASAGPGRRQ